MVQLPRAPSVSGKRMPTSCAASCSVARTTPGFRDREAVFGADRADAVHPPHRQQHRRAVGRRGRARGHAGVAALRARAARDARRRAGRSRRLPRSRPARASRGAAPWTRPRQSLTHGSISLGSVITAFGPELLLGLRRSAALAASSCGAIARLARARDTAQSDGDGQAADHPRRRPRAERRDRPRRQAAVAPPGRPQALQGADHGQRDGHGPQDLREPARAAAGPAAHRADARPRLAAPRAPRSRTTSTRRCGSPADEPVSVIGGAEIFELFLPLADRIELTEVLADVDGRHVHRRPARQRRLARDVQRRASGRGRPPAVPLRDAGARLGRRRRGSRRSARRPRRPRPCRRPGGPDPCAS